MAVKVLIKRKVAEKNMPELDALLRKMRALTLSRKGYISGESFNRERIELQDQIDKLLGAPTQYEIFENA
jgi:hypothetical protein